MSQGVHADRWPTWLGTALALGLFAVLLWRVLVPDSAWWSGMQRETVLIGDVPYRISGREWQGARAAALKALSAAEAEALLALEAELDERLVQLFDLPRQQIDVAADWYFSLPGQLVRAGGALGMDVGGRLIERLFPPQAWSEQQARLVASLAASADAQMRQSGEVVLTRFHRELRERRQEAAPGAEIPAFNFEVADNAFLELLQQDPALERQAVALATGTLAALAARRATQAAAARAAGRQVGAGLSAACVSTGVAAWICAGGVFGVTLLSTEAVLMRLDEAQNREEFEAVLNAELDRIEAEFAAQLQEAYLGALARSFEARSQTMREQLRPVDLLFGLAQDSPSGD